MIESTEEPELDSVTICDSHSCDEQQHQRLATETSSQSERIIRTATNEVIPPARRYPTRQRQPSVKLRDFWSLYSELLEEPISYSKAIQHAEWRRAINSEIDSIQKNDTWTVIRRPNNCKPITAKWLFKIK